MTERKKHPPDTPDQQSQTPSDIARDSDRSGIRGGTPGATDKGAITGIADTGGSSGAGGVRATSEQTGDISGIEAPRPQGDPFDISDETLRQILQHAHTIAVVGLKDDPEQVSYEVAHYLQQQGYRIVPVNPQATMILGEQAYPDLPAIPFPVDVVDLFRRSDAVGPHVDEAIQKGVGVIWMQLGIRNEDAARRAHRENIQVVMDHCMRQEHHRLIAHTE